jgi:hypothetical protein
VARLKSPDSKLIGGIGGTDERPALIASAKGELTKLLEGGRYPELADRCREILGRSRFSALLREELGKSVSPPEATHRPIVQIPYAAIATMNFDTK